MTDYLPDKSLFGVHLREEAALQDNKQLHKQSQKHKNPQTLCAYLTRARDLTHHSQSKDKNPTQIYTSLSVCMSIGQEELGAARYHIAFCAECRILSRSPLLRWGTASAPKPQSSWSSFTSVHSFQVWPLLTNSFTLELVGVVVVLDWVSKEGFI